MSMLLMVKAMQLKVGNPLRKLVLLKLADNASDTGECWPSYQHIAEQCEVSRRSAMNHIKQLEKDSLLKVVKRRKSASESYSNIYVLTLEGGSAGDSLGSAGDSPPSAGDSLGGSAGDSPRTSHSLEPVNEPIKNKQKKNASTKKKTIDKPAEIDELLWQDFLEVRRVKKAPLTQTAWNGILREVGKSEIDLSGALTLMVEKTWQSFNAEWVKNLRQGNNNGNGNQQFGSQPANETPGQRARRLNAEHSERVMANPNRTRSTDEHF